MGRSPRRDEKNLVQVQVQVQAGRLQAGVQAQEKKGR